MNGLALRISQAGGKKSKNSLCLAPLDISRYLDETLQKYELFGQFSKVESADEQLKILRMILEDVQYHEETAKFLVVVFFHAEAKHPVKCFVTRHITKNAALQPAFTNALIAVTLTAINHEHKYEYYSATVNRIATCLDNFATGVAAVKAMEYSLMEYLKNCLMCCVDTLRGPRTLSPTEKNEIFNLVHLTLRILLHIVQKFTTDKLILNLIFEEIRHSIKQLLFDEDAPMDTKSVCGILFLNIHVLENGSESWMDILQKQSDGDIANLLFNDAAELSLCSAVATVAAMDQLQMQTIDGTPAIIVLIEKILAIGERSSSESTFTLCVSRTLYQISKNLTHITDGNTGLTVTARVLMFVWPHLEHHMDSVRHLAGQILGHVVRYCTHFNDKGDGAALRCLWEQVGAIDRGRKTYCVAAAALARQLPASLVATPDLMEHLLDALQAQHLQASATTALETLLQKHLQQSSAGATVSQWVRPVLLRADSAAPAALQALTSLLAAAAKAHAAVAQYILSYIKQSTNSQDLKCTLMLLSVARKAGMAEQNTDSAEESNEMWKGMIGYDVLDAAAVAACDETRILSLSLVAESPKSTAAFTQRELAFVLRYLRYNINAQSPNFRQLTLAVMKKFMKRLEDSYKGFKKQSSEDYYRSFIEQLRAFCFDSLVPGANYGRRYAALQTLAWSERVTLDGYQKVYNQKYVEKLLLHLEDSYECNKAFALDILENCPVDVIKNNNYSISLQLSDITAQACSLKPTECVSAAYKLSLLRNKLPDTVLQGDDRPIPELVTYVIVQHLVHTAQRHLAACRRSVVRACVAGPMYGPLHCLRKMVALLDPAAISPSQQWSELISETISLCFAVNAAVAGVVNNASPEGHLPADMGAVGPLGDSAGEVRMSGGRPVTAQMVLLCAWRSVKEVSLLLGEISSRLTISGEGCDVGTVSPQQIAALGQHFTALLAETKHRGAFEQAYVGFTQLLTRLWQCQSPELHGLPRHWLLGLMAAIESGKRGSLCATRRSAGLPFLIQALVTTELQVQGNPKCFHQCMATLLRLAEHNPSSESKTANTTAISESEIADNAAISKSETADSAAISESETAYTAAIDMSETTNSTTMSKSETDTGAAISESETDIERRTHAINILRALFRNSALEESVSGYVGSGLLVALRGFGGATWMERNSSTLLFSALMVRVFGVQRSRDAENLCVRNRMTGRIFFLRYPRLYDYMLEKLKEASNSEGTQLVPPSLYPTLLLLARLYPSALEGTVSNLKLASFIPYVSACARSRVLTTRRLAATAIVPLIPPHMYIAHVEALLQLICDNSIERNYCHGVLLQLIRLIDAKPEAVSLDNATKRRLGDIAQATVWVLGQATGKRPCYLLADEYVKAVNLILWRLPTIITKETIQNIENNLQNLIFNDKIPKINSGRDLCLANALYLYFVILNKYNTYKIIDVIIKSLSHKSYEVILTTLNYILILYGDIEIEGKFQEHLSKISDKNILENLKGNQNYIQLLCNIINTNKYPECVQKSLKILTLENDTEKFIVESKICDKNTIIDDKVIINTLIDCIQNEHENLMHVYLKSLTKFVTKKVKEREIIGTLLLDVIRIVFECSSSDKSEETRSVVVEFLENNLETLFELEQTLFMDDGEKFEFRATILATAATALEDDCDALRRRAAAAVAGRGELPCRAAGGLRDMAAQGDAATAVLLVLALLDFRAEVCVADSDNEECRVFDHNEKYNIFLEESVWTVECAKIIKQLRQCEENLKDYIINIIHDPVYKSTFDKLCGNNVIFFEEMCKNSVQTNDLINPKIRLFVNSLI